MVRLSFRASASVAALAVASALSLGGAQAQQAAPQAAAEPAAQANAKPRRGEKPAPTQVEAFDTINVTATKTEEKAIESLGAVTTVTQQDVQRYGASSMAEAMRNIPGVAFQESPNNPGQAINIRGLQDFGRVNVLIDGARQNYQISGHNANGEFYFDPEFMGQVDVVRGPISNIYGSGAIGGVVSIRTKDVDDVLKPDEKYGVLQRIGAGTNGQHFFNSTAVAARISPNVEAFGQFVYRSNSAYTIGSGAYINNAGRQVLPGGAKVDDTGSELMGGLGKIRIRPADGHEITISAMKQGFQFSNNGTSTTGSRFWDDVKTDNYTIGYRFNPADNLLIDLNAKAYYTQTNNVQTLIQPTATYFALNALPGAKLNDKIRTRGFDINNTSRFSTGVFDHALTFGGDSSWDRVNTTDYAGGYVSALTPSGDRRLSGAFVQDEMRFGRLVRVLGALRYDDYALSGGSYSSSGSRLSPKLIVGVSPFEGIEVYGSYSEGYRAPAITETLISGLHPFPAFTLLPNPGLKPEVAHNLEAGLNLKYDSIFNPEDKFRAKVNIFQNKVKNFIDMGTTGATTLVIFIPGLPNSFCAFIPAACANFPVYQYQNVANAELNGVEAEGAYDWGWGFASAAFSSVNGVDQSTGRRLNSVYPGRFSSTLGLRFFDKALTVGGRYSYTKEVWGTTCDPAGANVMRCPGYGTVDLFGNYKFDERVSADVSLLNIFNKTYAQYNSTLPSAGFTAKFALSVKFASK
ncbi:MAG: TonB-dependent hemoglobin/transferrin/lactoferrin family receptor [Rhodoblastus sp.]